MPEIWLVVAMCAVLIAPFVKRRNVTIPTLLAVAGLLAAMLFTLLWQSSDPSAENFRTVFSNSLAIDPFSQFFKMMLFLFAMLIVVQWVLIGRSQTDALDVPDFLCLVLGATFGMSLMVSANNLLTIFIAIESASLPSFALAGFRKHQNRATEGSLKYILLGAVASSLMIYGMSLVYGSSGSLDLATIAQHASSEGISPLMGIGLLGMFAGFAFKLSAVPLHFWCPDVFEGASFEVTTFLSVASKAAAMCLLVRVLSNFAMFSAVESITGMAVGLGVLGAITATWGNLVALHQTNIKRLLAYSSISHAGYMIMGASVILLVNPTAIVSALLFYILVYMFMNLGAFTVAAVLAAQLGSEDIRDYAGLIKRSPLLSILMTLFMLSLFGMPGLGGFMGKLFLGTAMIQAGGIGALLVAILLLNTLFSLWYYLRPSYFMIFVKPNDDDAPSTPLARPSTATLALLGWCVLMLFWTGILPNSAIQTTREYAAIIVKPAVRQTLSQSTPKAEPKIDRKESH